MTMIIIDCLFLLVSDVSDESVGSLAGNSPHWFVFQPYSMTNIYWDSRGMYVGFPVGFLGDVFRISIGWWWGRRRRCWFWYLFSTCLSSSTRFAAVTALVSKNCAYWFDFSLNSIGLSWNSCRIPMMALALDWFRYVLSPPSDSFRATLHSGWHLKRVSCGFMSS